MQKQHIQDYDKIGGWLIVVALGFFGTALRVLVSLVTDYVPLFTNGTWTLLLTSPSVVNGAAIAVFFVLEILVNLGIFAYSVFLLFQMRDKKPSFPKNAIVFYSSNLIFVIFDLVVYFQLIPKAGDAAGELFGNLGRAIISSSVWIPYFLRSNRVKQTFRVRPTFGAEEKENK